ncbi:helix-turn-helix domain-containing protein [uncultured Rhodospira sp.]|uniref:helix-turn-helix transcriptional regulator n=1 Tax=uncultured Rhodospira sp. TaxID=1936189 RepID=UPI0026387950|nr:helix-turn-helix domain-containing protein [uncultured Rhodospira sp.]
MRTHTPHTPDPADIYLTAADVAARLGISRSYLDQARVRGDGPPFVRIGRAVRYRWGAVIEWAEARAARSTSEPTPADRAA